MRKKTFVAITIALALGLMLSAPAPSAWAQAVAPTPLNASKIPQFVDPLPDLAPPVPNATGTMETFVFDTSLSLYMHEFKAKVLPTGTFIANQVPDTWVWGYRKTATAPTAAVDTYIGPVVLALRNIPTQIKFVNLLGETANSNVLAYTQSTDQTLHWANPRNLLMGDPARLSHYFGPIPAVAHLHGGEVPPVIDGGPDAWFLSSTTTPTGYSQHGAAYYTRPGVAANANEAVYRYPNTQEGANIWFHDHTLGATRLNVYAGIAGAYPLIDSSTLNFYTTELPYPLVPLVIQDRMFDTTGQLFFPNVGLNPTVHPFWVPEFVGDTIVVNGKVWPFKNVAAQPYRFLFLNGSNARAYEIELKTQGKGGKAPLMWQIGTDGGYLDTAVSIGTGGQVPKLVIMPGERADVFIDFTGFPVGTKILMTNTARTPYPAGGPVKGSTTGRIMQFNVVATDTAHSPGTFDPTADPNIRTGAANSRPNQIVRLPGTPQGPAIDTTPNIGNVQVVRQLTLNEVIGPGGPLEILVNNTKWSGKRPDDSYILGPAVQIDAAGNQFTEFPNEGDTEIWQIINLTADAHPIHLHLVQYQLVSRQTFDVKGYLAAYATAFPGGSGIDTVAGPNLGGNFNYAQNVYAPAFGPPLPYNTPNADGAVGGNPAVTPFLLGAALPPAPNEEGWKDTVIMFPGQVTTIAVRFAPTDLPNTTLPANAYYPFDPNVLQGDYVWHCHIIDHEDNEMMRPYQVNPNGVATRTYVQGLGNDY
jgi:spore coat protein A